MRVRSWASSGLRLGRHPCSSVVSRFGVWKQVMLAIALIIVVKFAESTAENMMRTMPEAWMVPYLPILVGIVITMVLLTIATYPARFRFPKGRIAA